MRTRKILTLTILTITLALAINGRTNLLPNIIRANAVLTCPTGGVANACLTVSLDVISKPTKTANAVCTVPPGQYGTCDTLINTSASNATTFRVGAIINASGANPATSTVNCGGSFPIQCGVFVWQFGIRYDPNLVTPAGDPTSRCTAYPDCGESTVWYGSQTGPGQVNWASFGPSQALQFKVINEDLAAHKGEIIVYFAFFAPAPPVTISARNVLANVAFALVGKGTVNFGIADVIFGDQNGVQIPGIIGAPTLQNDNKLKYADLNSNGVWDSGEPVIYDSNSDGKYSAGTYYSDILVAGTAPANNTALSSDPKIRYLELHSDSGDNVWDASQGEPVVYDSNNNYLYDTGDTVISGSAPSTPCTAGALPTSTCGAASDTITNDPPHASFTATQISPYAFTFNSTSTDSDDTITGYYWDFGDGTVDLNQTGPVILAHDYGATCAAGCVSGSTPLTLPTTFTVTLRVVDSRNATSSARDQSGAVITNGQPSHVSHSVLADKPPIAAFSFSPSTPAPAQTVSFDASASNDPDGTIASYSWDFNDTSTGTGQTNTHAFTAQGVYHVKLTVTDNLGIQSSIRKDVTIATPRQPPTITATVPSTAQTGVTVTISITSSSSGTVASIKVDWGDGKTDNLPGTATTATHTYANAGSYNVTVTATDDQGLATTTPAKSISVAAAPQGIQIPGGIATIIAIPVAAIVAIVALLLLRRRKPSPKPVAS